MKAAKVFVTLDGTNHQSKKAAEDWCENRYRERIAKVAHKIVATDFNIHLLSHYYPLKTFKSCCKMPSSGEKTQYWRV